MSEKDELYLLVSHNFYDIAIKCVYPVNVALYDNREFEKRAP
jgi:hypothetical protein